MGKTIKPKSTKDEPKRKWLPVISVAAVFFIVTQVVVYASSNVQQLSTTNYQRSGIVVVEPQSFANATVVSTQLLNVTSNAIVGYTLAGNQSLLTGGLNGTVANLTYLVGGSPKLTAGYPVNASVICYTTTVTTGTFTKACTAGQTSIAFGNYSLQIELSVTSNVAAHHPTAGFDMEIVVGYCYGSPSNPSACTTHETVAGTAYIGSASGFYVTLFLYMGLGVGLQPTLTYTSVNFNYCPNSPAPGSITHC